MDLCILILVTTDFVFLFYIYIFFLSFNFFKTNPYSQASDLILKHMLDNKDWGLQIRQYHVCLSTKSNRI